MLTLEKRELDGEFLTERFAFYLLKWVYLYYYEADNYSFRICELLTIHGSPPYCI